jgi:hypothetical protein
MLQVLSQLFAVCGELSNGGTPLNQDFIEVLIADANPIAFELRGSMSDLRLKLVGNLLIEIDEDVAEVTHKVGINVNLSHDKNSFCTETLKRVRSI